VNNDEIAELREQNIERAHALHAQGAPLPSHMVFNTFLTTLVDQVLPAGAPSRRRFDEAVERGMADLLTQAEQNLNRARLMASMEQEPLRPREASQVINVNEVPPQEGWRS